MVKDLLEEQGEIKAPEVSTGPLRDRNVQTVKKVSGESVGMDVPDRFKSCRPECLEGEFAGNAEFSICRPPTDSDCSRHRV